jgi:hypothetical protein
MKDQVNNNDVFLRNLVKKAGTEKVPDDFTNNVMQKIKTAEENEQIVNQPFITRKTWFLMATAFIVLIVLLFFVDWSFIGLNLSPEEVDVQNYKKIVPYFTNIVEGLGSAFSFFTNSSIPIIVIIGTISLILIDRMLKRFSVRRSYLV